MLRQVCALFSAVKPSPMRILFSVSLEVPSALTNRVCTGYSLWTLCDLTRAAAFLFFCSDCCQKLTFYLICGLSPRADVVPALICASAPPCSAQLGLWSPRACFPLAFVIQLNTGRATRCLVCCSHSPHVDIYPFGVGISCPPVI